MKPKKPKKPFADFPLFAHSNGQWCKKIRQKLNYFGLWNDPTAAMQKYLAQRDYLQAGLVPRDTRDGCRLLDIANRFLTDKRKAVRAGELSESQFRCYFNTCEGLLAHFEKERHSDDLTADDFSGYREKLAKRLGPVALGNEIQRVRTLFKYAFESEWIDVPVRFGPSFKKPTQQVVRAARQAKGKMTFSPAELLQVLDAAGNPMRAMVLLGLNAGLGNRDVALLPLTAIDLKSGWLDFPRPKTAVPRRVPLWPETIEAITAAIEKRPKPADDAANLVFLTRFGKCWVEFSAGEKAAWKDSVGLQFGKLLRSIGLKRPGVNFYVLRRMTETVGGEAKDQPALDAIMGHAHNINDMGAVYRQGISDDRLRAVTDRVRGWLFTEASVAHV